MNETEVLDLIREQIYGHDVVLYLKGTAEEPQDSWSAGVVQMLRNMDVKFMDINVLPNYTFRHNLKKITNYYCIPQLYIKGELIGGYDLLYDMYARGELQDMMRQKGIIN